ncbi:MAG: hypothetical protein ACRDQA_24135 [Nocardioidaceae bacterium]
MPGKKMLADPDGLHDVARQLRDGADELNSAASTVPHAPDAGLSTANVGAAVSALARSAAALMVQSEDNADKIHASNGSYGATENTNTQSLDGVLKHATNGTGGTDPLGPLDGPN